MEQKEVNQNFNLPSPEYNFQVVYKVDNHRRIVFVGDTNLSIDDLLNQCDESLDLGIVPFVESISYSPINLIENGSEKK